MLFGAQNWLLLDIQKKYITTWQRTLFSDFMESEWSYFSAQKTGEMTNGILAEVLRLGAAFFAVLQLIVATVVLCVYLVIASFIFASVMNLS